MKMYRNDLKPDLQILLTDDEVAVDLTTATSIRVIGKTGMVILFDRTVTGTAEGIITMGWETTDTDATCRILVEVEVMWPGSKPQTFRPIESIDIVDDYA